MASVKKDLPVIAALAAFIKGIVEDKLDELRVDHSLYTSSAPAPKISTRVHNEVCRSGKVRGAYKDGRAWICTRHAWNEARATKPKMATVHVLPLEDLDREANEALEAVGLRPTKRASK